VTLVGWIVSASRSGAISPDRRLCHDLCGLASAMIALVFLYWTANLHLRRINQAVRKAQASRKEKGANKS
jgi:hypothetical protein